MAKKFNKGRRQKKNIDKQKLDKYREEIARELGVSLPENKKNPETRKSGNDKPALKFEDDKSIF